MFVETEKKFDQRNHTTLIIKLREEVIIVLQKSALSYHRLFCFLYNLQYL